MVILCSHHIELAYSISNEYPNMRSSELVAHWLALPFHVGSGAGSRPGGWKEISFLARTHRQREELGEVNTLHGPAVRHGMRPCMNCLYSAMHAQ